MDPGEAQGTIHITGNQVYISPCIISPASGKDFLRGFKLWSRLDRKVRDYYILFLLFDEVQSENSNELDGNHSVTQIAL